MLKSWFGEMLELGMADHVWRGKGYQRIVREHFRINQLKEPVHKLGSNNFFSRPSKEISTIWKPLIKKEMRQKLRVHALDLRLQKQVQQT